MQIATGMKLKGSDNKTSELKMQKHAWAEGGRGVGRGVVGPNPTAQVLI